MAKRLSGDGTLRTRLHELRSGLCNGNRSCIRIASIVSRILFGALLRESSKV